MDDGWIHSLAFPPDDRVLVSGHENGAVRLWNPVTYELTHLLLGHTSEVRDLAISADGQTLVTACEDGAVKAWNLLTLESRETETETNSMISELAISANRNLLAYQEYGGIHVFDTAGGLQQFEVDERTDTLLHFLASSGDGKYL